METKMRSKQEQALTYLRAFSKKDAKTELEIYRAQYKIFSYDRHNLLYKAVAKLNPSITREKQGDTKAWGEFIDTVYKLLNEPTCTRSLHSGNLISIYKRSKVMRRYKSKGVWRYYLSGSRS